MDSYSNSGSSPRSFPDDVDAPTKRISTPAGMRLSVIMQNTVDQKSRPRRPSKTGTLKSGTVSKGSTLVGDPRESKEERMSGPMGYSYDIFSEKAQLPPPSLLMRLKSSRLMQRKGGWKRVLLVCGVLLICIIAIAVGTAIGLKQSNKSSTNSQSSDATPASAGAASQSGTATATGALATNTQVPSGFPAGTYSFTTFLDTVNTDCTSDPATWSCYPYTIYNNDHVKALSTFNWVIKEASSKASYEISSLQNPFDINFQNAAMNILDKGTDNERYQFQIQMDKSVVPSTSITNDGSSATCFYNSTTMTGYLYTKRAKDYPTSEETVNSTYPAWPFSVRVEQTAAGGEGVPNCYKTVDGSLGAQVGNFTAENATTLCSCLYRNYLTPEP
ncbi:uncharacterized protein PV09_00540 [Verruconis gallopava]|uniref:Tat pathway signal sequence n=1 Tax=Verruconis gallopava TaxID=253628 RepID=A0A0D1Y0K1_9PEZI|nr:uncharacterized protein PV09_00540 [Verruconis gallopava]KIW08576.1 hypothetical protein PV09_00540 [Verruconis gallopava]